MSQEGPSFAEMMRALAIPVPGGIGEDFPVSAVVSDSRLVEKGSIFVAVRGRLADGHRYMGDAIQRGARVIIAERKEAASEAPLSQKIPLIEVENARRTYALLNHLFFGRPSEKLKLIGVTGTNGKTTSATLLHEIWRRREPAGLVTTVETKTPRRSIASSQTTPDPRFLQGFLREMVEGGARTAILEVSSHALDQERVGGLEFDYALFTNLSQDHLDYHRNMENYLQAKLRLFRQMKKGGVAVLNRDDPAYATLIGALSGRGVSYGLGNEADFWAREVRSDLGGSSFKVFSRGSEIAIDTPLIGLHNVCNILGVFALATTAGLPVTMVQSAIRAFRGVSGRLEWVNGGQAFSLFIDYAHTEDGLRKTLSALRPFAARKLLVLFGCGGDRDKEKRPLMARAAAEAADFIVLTSDNPRSEDPRLILKHIVSGFSEGFRSYEVQPDRRKAIRSILLRARKGDVVILAGKGHETYQIVGERRIPFSDREECLKVLAGH